MADDSEEEFGEWYQDRIAEDDGDNEHTGPDLGDGASDDDVAYESGSAQAQIMELPGGRDLLNAWGGNFDENFAHARTAFEHASENMPDFIESLATPIEREDGSTYIPGDDPKWLKLAADYGRLMAHRDGIETDFAANAGNRQTRDAGPEQVKAITMPTHKEGIQEQIDDLEERHPPGTPAWKKPKVQRQLAALYDALHPEPIVGGRDELGQRHM